MAQSIKSMLNPDPIVDPSTWVDPVKWIQEHYYIPETQRPIILAPYHKAVLREALRHDDEGKLIYTTVVWSDIKKSAKSSIAAAVALYRARNQAWASIKIVANDLKQADSRVMEYVRRSVRLHPQHDARTSGNTIHFGNSSKIEAIPIDPAGEAGGTDHLIVFSELWAAKHRKYEQMWTEMTPPPTLFGFSQRWVETYAGFDGDSPILEGLYDQGMAGDQLDLSYTDEDGQYHDLSDLQLFANGRLLLLWNGQPRCPWQTPEYYADQRTQLTPSEFDRVHGNIWATSQQKFIPMEWWRDCRGTLDKREDRKLTLGVDAGISDDRFAIVGTDEIGGVCHIKFCQTWAAPAGGKIEFSTYAKDGPEDELVRLLEAGKVEEIRFDPYQLHDMMIRLEKKYRGRCRFVEFKQGQMRLISDKQLYDRIKGRQIRHNYDDDADLSTHLDNADRQEQGDNRLRIVKRSQDKKIDAAVALSMAAQRDELATDTNADDYQDTYIPDFENPWG